MEHQSQGQTDFIEDAFYVIAAQNGDHAAFEVLANRYRPMVFAVVRSKVVEQDVDDVIQDAFSIAWEKISSLKDSKSFAAWLKSITINLSRSHNRQAARRKTSTGIEDEQFISDFPDPLEIVLRSEQSLEIQNALASISPENRRALIMHLWARYEYSEIAQKLNLPVTTVVGRIHRAKDQLRRLLGVPEPVRVLRRKGMDRMLDEIRLIPQLGNSHSVSLIAVSTDGRRFASGDAGGTVVVWNLETGLQEIRITRLGYVDSLCFSPDGTKIAASGFDNRTAVWDVERGVELAVLPVHGRPLQFDSDGKSLWSAIYSPDPDNKQWVQSSVLLWDILTKKVIKRIEGLPGTPKALSSDARTFATVYGKPEYSGSILLHLNDTEVMVWDLPDMKERCRLSGLEGMPMHLVLDPTGRYLAATSRDPGTSTDILVWSAIDGKLLYRLSGHNLQVKMIVSSLAFSPDGNTLASSDPNGLIILWRMEDGKELRRIEAKGRVPALAFSLDGQQLFSSDSVNSKLPFDPADIVIRKVSCGETLRRFEHMVRVITSAVFSHDASLMASIGSGSVVPIWDFQHGVLAKSLDISPCMFALSVAFHPSNNQIAVCANELVGTEEKMHGKVIVWDRLSGQKLHELNDDGRGFAQNVAFTPNGSHAVVGWQRENISIYDADWHEEKVIHYKEGFCSGGHLSISPDGRILAACTIKFQPSGYIERGELTLWDIGSDEMLKQWTEEMGGFQKVAFSPDCKKIAVSIGSSKSDTRSQEEIRILDVSSGKEERRFMVPGTQRLTSLFYSKDGENIAVASVDGTVVLLNSACGEIIASVARNSGWTDISLSPDGRLMVSWGVDGVLRLWDFESVAHGKLDKELVSMVSFNDGGWVAYTPDGYYDCSPGAERYLVWNKSGKILRAGDCPNRRREGLIGSVTS